MTWNDGYVTDSEYTSHYFGELAPAHLNLMCLASGVLPPAQGEKRFRYCELGCGNGMSTNILAAANPEASFVGIDFMPVHIANARRAALRGGLENVEFLEMSFAQACERSFEPFDYIVAHGVYSWITAQNRAEMVAFFRKFLAPGGLVYLSYNCYPGWLTVAPVQKLVSEYAGGLRGASTQRVREGFEFAKSLMEKGASAFTSQPAAKQQIERAPQQPANYLAQEYLNEAWYPLYVTDVMREMGDAKLRYVASATAAENDLRFIVTDEVAAVIRAQPTEELRQLVKDIACNARFRRDIYSRGGRQLTGLDQRQMLSDQLVALTRDAAGISFQAEYFGRKINFDTPLARKAVDRLAQGPATLEQIGEAMVGAGAKDGIRAALEVVMILVVSMQALPLSPVTRADATVFNRSLAAAGLEDSASNALATAFGTGVGVSPLELAMISTGAALTDKPALIAGMKALAKRKGRVFNKAGQALEKDAEIDDFLGGEIDVLQTKRLQALQALGVVSA